MKPSSVVLSTDEAKEEELEVINETPTVVVESIQEKDLGVLVAETVVDDKSQDVSISDNTAKESK